MLSCSLLAMAQGGVHRTTPPSARRMQAQQDTLCYEQQQQFLYYFYEATRYFQQEDYNNAWQLIQFCYYLNPNDACVNHYMGMYLKNMERNIEAWPYIQRAFELQPNEYWYQYALFLLQKEDRNAHLLAIRSLEKVATDNPKEDNLHSLLQDAYIHVQDYKKALAIQDQLDSIIGYNANSAMLRYRLNAVLGNELQAIREVERYLEEEPSDLQFQAFRLELYEKTNQPSEKLIQAYEAILPYDPHNWIIMNNLAWHLCLIGKELDRAEKLSRNTILAEPTNPVYLDTYAWIMYQMGDYDSAAFYIQRALEYSTPETKKDILTHYRVILKKIKL